MQKHDKTSYILYRQPEHFGQQWRHPPSNHGRDMLGCSYYLSYTSRKGISQHASKPSRFMTIPEPQRIIKQIWVTKRKEQPGHKSSQAPRLMSSSPMSFSCSDLDAAMNWASNCLQQSCYIQLPTEPVQQKVERKWCPNRAYQLQDDT